MGLWKRQERGRKRNQNEKQEEEKIRVIAREKSILTGLDNPNSTSPSSSHPNQPLTSSPTPSLSATPNNSIGSLGCIPSNKDLKVALALSDNVFDQATNAGIYSIDG